MKNHTDRSRPSSSPRQSFAHQGDSRDERASLSQELNKEQAEALEKIRERQKILLEVMNQKASQSENKAAWKAYIDQYERDMIAFHPDRVSRLTPKKQKALEQLLRGYESHFAKDLKERKDLKQVTDRVSIKAPEEVFVTNNVYEIFGMVAHHTVGFKFDREYGWIWFHPDQNEMGNIAEDGYHIERTRGYDGDGIKVVLDDAQQGTNFSYVLEAWDKYEDFQEEASPTEPDSKTRTFEDDPFS